MIDTRDYDADIQMFREEPRPVDMARLAFFRWLSEQGRLEREPVGPPSGKFATRPPRQKRASGPA